MPEMKFTRVGMIKPMSSTTLASTVAARADIVKPAADVAAQPVAKPAVNAAAASAATAIRPDRVMTRNIPDMVASPKSLARKPEIATISPDNLKIINVGMWNKIGRVRPLPGQGSTRESLNLPVSPIEDFTDATVFEAATGAGRFYLPRYKLAIRTVSGSDQYAIRIEKAPEGDWVLRATLEKTQAPGIPSGASELEHEILVRLVYSIAMAGGGATTKELSFQEVAESADKRSLTTTLRFASPAERDQALAAITQSTGAAGLKVTRSVRVAIPVGTNTPQLYRAVTRGVDQIADPNPLFLNASLHPYLFEGQAPSGNAPGLIVHQIKWGDRFYSYWQDAVRPELFFYLPDAFRLARRGKPAPFLPMMSIRVENATASPEGALITLEFAATPFIDQARIADARKQLAKHVPAKSTAPKPPAGAAQPAAQPSSLGGLFGRALGSAFGGDAGRQIGEALGGAVSGSMTSGSKQSAAEKAIVFEPMPVQKASLWLAVTGAGLTEQTGAQVEVRAAVYHSMTMPIAQFQAVFDALMGGAVALMRGEIRLDLGEETPEIIPLELRFDRMNGELFTAQATRNATDPGAIDVTLTNAIESPLELRKVTGWIGINDLELAAEIDNLALPATIAAGASQQLQLVFQHGLPDGEVQPLFDFTEVVAKPDATVMWQTILDPSTPAEYQKTIQVRAVSSMFDPPPDKPNERVFAILVQFETGGTVELTPSKLEGETKIRMPLASMILGTGGPANYRYRCQVIRAGSRQQDTTWREDSFDILFPAFPSP